MDYEKISIFKDGHFYHNWLVCLTNRIFATDFPLAHL